MNADNQAEYKYLMQTYGIATATRYLEVVSRKLGTTNKILHQPKKKKTS